MRLKNNIVVLFHVYGIIQYCWLHSDKEYKYFEDFDIGGDVDRFLLKTFPFIKYEKMQDISHSQNSFIKEIASSYSDFNSKVNK
jgi:hypothetical protein